MSQAIEQLAEMLTAAKYVIAFTGAGISTESGIPDFRSKGEGLWEKVAPEILSAGTLRSNPALFYRYFREMEKTVTGKEPNRGHLAVAEDARGQGIGAELVAHMLRRAGACRAVLDVATGNARAAALYARCGFAVTATRRGGARNGRGQISDHYRMERGQTGPAQYSAV